MILFFVCCAVSILFVVSIRSVAIDFFSVSFVSSIENGTEYIFAVAGFPILNSSTTKNCECIRIVKRVYVCTMLILYVFHSMDPMECNT